MVCSNCGREFEAKRKSARYCSSSCRVKHGRKGEEVEEVKPVTPTVIETKAVQKKDNACKCEFTEMKKCIRSGKGEKACEKLHAFYICGRHAEHIEGYCDAICEELL